MRAQTSVAKKKVTKKKVNFEDGTKEFDGTRDLQVCSCGAGVLVDCCKGNAYRPTPGTAFDVHCSVRDWN